MAHVSTVRRFLFWFLSLGVAIASWRFIVLGVPASMDFVAYHAIERKLAFFGHIIFAPVALALLPFQFRVTLRATRPAVHRWIGRAYGLAVLISGVGGLFLAFGTRAGPVAAAGFGLLAVLWLGCTGLGIAMARAGKAAQHRRWMIRSAALTFAAVTLRLYLPILIAGGLAFPAAYSIVAWLCWVPNLLVAEGMRAAGYRRRHRLPEREGA
ncbi:DUF2306 domain-containing protein [Actibacterium sp. D379-3]